MCLLIPLRQVVLRPRSSVQMFKTCPLFETLRRSMSDCDVSGSVRSTPSGTTHPSSHEDDNDVPARDQLTEN